jgi:hypothetical protein
VNGLMPWLLMHESIRKLCFRFFSPAGFKKLTIDGIEPLPAHSVFLTNEEADRLREAESI